MVGAFWQLMVHVFADYWVQSDWAAQNKTKAWAPAVVHALIYTACFLVLTRSPTALAVIGLTHLAIDHWRLARFICFAKNYLAPPSAWLPWAACKIPGALIQTARCFYGCGW